jgi:hypothetical protein
MRVSLILRGDRQLAVVVAVLAVLMVQVAVHQVVDVTRVRNGLVPAVVAVLMLGLVTPAAMVGRAAIRMRVVDLEHVLVDVIAVRMVQVAVVHVIDVVAVCDSGVPATGAVLMCVIGMGAMLVHAHQSPLPSPRRQAAESETRS